MKPLDRTSFVRSKNRNILLSKDLQSQSRMYKSNQKHYDFQPNIQLPINRQEKLKTQPRFQLDLKRNPQLNILRGGDRKLKIEEKNNQPFNKSSLQQTTSGFNKQYKQPSHNKFYQTSINGFLINNNRPMSKKNNREKFKLTNRPDNQFQYHYEDQIPHIENKQSKRYPYETQSYIQPSTKRPQTSKGQRRRGVQNKQTGDEDLMNQLIPQVFEQPQLFKLNKKQESFETSIHSEKKQTVYPYKKKNHPMSASEKKCRDVSDMIKLNSSTQRKSVKDYVVPFQTTLSPQFIGLFANGK